MGRIKLLSVLTAYICLLVLVCGLIAGAVLPQHDTALLYAVPAYFWLLYAAVVMALKRGLGSETAARYLMLFKGAKMLLTMVVMFVMAFLFRENAKEIILLFFVYYIALLLPESIFVAKMKNN